MLRALLGACLTVSTTNLFYGKKLMSAIENLKREVAESTQQQSLLVDLVKSLKSDMSGMADTVTKLREDLADAIADNGSDAEFQALADQLETSQRAADDVLGVKPPVEPEGPTGATGPVGGEDGPTGATGNEEGPTGPTGPTDEPEAPTGPTGPDEPTDEQR